MRIRGHYTIMETTNSGARLESRTVKVWEGGSQ